MLKNVKIFWDDFLLISSGQVEVVGSLDPFTKLLVVTHALKENVILTCDYIAKAFGFKVVAADEIVCSIEEWKLNVRSTLSSRTLVFLEEQDRKKNYIKNHRK